MTLVVIDASVVVKWLIWEEYEEEARRLLRPLYQRLAPQLLWAEVGNVLWKRWQRGDLDVQTSRSLLRTLARTPLMVIDLQDLVSRALVLAQETDRTVYDCTYLALALDRGCQLVTADRRFYNAMQGTAYAGMMLWVEDVS